MRKSCIDCQFHKIVPDPDPFDEFCRDDVGVVCTLVVNDDKQEFSLYLIDKHENKSIAVSCRPYNVKKEAIVPHWCPLKKT